MALAGSWESFDVGLSAYPNCMAYGAGVYVVGANGGKVATSPDGVNWTPQATILTGQDVWGLAYGAGLFVAVGPNGKLATSPDGVTWTNRTSSFSTTHISGVIYANGLFVAFGWSGKLATSTTGTSWTQRSSGFGIDTIECATYGAGLFVAGGGSGKLATSPDGVTWTHRSVGFGFNYVSSLLFTGTVFISAGYDNQLATSVDGVTWVGRDPLPIAPGSSAYGTLLTQQAPVVLASVSASSGYPLFASSDYETWDEPGGTPEEALKPLLIDGSALFFGGDSLLWRATFAEAGPADPFWTNFTLTRELP